MISIPRKLPNHKDIQQVLPRLLLSDSQKEILLPSWKRPLKGLPKYLNTDFKWFSYGEVFSGQDTEGS